MEGTSGVRGTSEKSTTRRVKSSVLAVVVLALVAMIGLDADSDGTVQRIESLGGSQLDSTEMIMPTASSYVPDAPVLVPEGWTATASSETRGHTADAVISGISGAYWQSRNRAALPQSVTIDLGGPEELSALSYEPRQGSGETGAIGRFAITVSTDGKHYGSPVATGTWQNTEGEKTIGFAPVTVGWIRLTALGYAAGSGTYVTAAAVTLYGKPGEEATLDAFAAARISKNPGVVGEWGASIGFPLVPVAAALLPDNQLLTWSSDANESFAPAGTANWTQTAILNLNTGVVGEETVSDTHDNMFCPGVAILANGEIIVAGGDSSTATSIYDPATDAWSKGPPLNIPRGYNGATLLSDGQAFTLGGSWSGERPSGGRSAELWSETGGWRVLPGVPENSILTHDTERYLADSYGWFISVGNGEVLQAGPSEQMHLITTSGAGSIVSVGNRASSRDAMEGNAVYFDTNQVLTLGGAADFTGTDATNDPATNRAYVINFAGPTPQVTKVGSMHFPRTYSNSVVLPNSEVVVIGGQTSGWGFHDTNSVLNPELWDPSTGQFTVMAPEADPRNYHSVAVLLPNGQVFSGGGGLCGIGCTANQPDGQIYSPPYLFNANGTPATRPTITSAPSAATDGQTITVTTGGPVSSFSMVRYGESTHSSDDDQRCIPLPVVSSKKDTYQLTIPASSGTALPGPYMLFAMNAQGTPSVSTTIMISDVATSEPDNAYGDAVLGDGPAIYWPLGDSQGEDAADLSGNLDTGTYSSTGVTYGAPSPVEQRNGEGVTLDGASGEIQATQQTVAPSRYTASMWFETTSDTGGYLMSFASPVDGQDQGIPAFDDDQVWMTDSGQIAVGESGMGGLSNISGSSYNDGDWHYVVVVADRRHTDLYVDGQLVAQSTSTTCDSGLGSWLVGYGAPANTANEPTDDYFAGTISDVAFYDFDLRSPQIQSLYEASPASG
jgi:galactose oxidase